MNTGELWVALTAREARALANAANVTAAIVGAGSESAAEAASDKLRLALIEIGEAPL